MVKPWNWIIWRSKGSKFDKTRHFTLFVFLIDVLKMICPRFHPPLNNKAHISSLWILWLQLLHFFIKKMSWSVTTKILSLRFVFTIAVYTRGFFLSMQVINLAKSNQFINLHNVPHWMTDWIVLTTSLDDSVLGPAELITKTGKKYFEMKKRGKTFCHNLN